MSNTPTVPQSGADKPSTLSFGSFGNTNTTTAPSLFGQAGAPTEQPKSLFGGATGGTSSGFGSLAQNASGGGSGTGTPLSSGGLFGFQPKQDENKQQAPLGFAALSTPNKPSVFDGPGQPQSSNAFGSFGGNTTASTQAPSGSATPTTSQPPSLFGNPSTTPAGLPPVKSPNLFGGFGQTEKTGQGLFGNLNMAQNASQDSQAAPAGTNPFGSKPQSPSLFGQTSSTPQSTSTLFGAQGSAQSGSNLFGKPTSEANRSDSTSTSAATPTAFGGFKTTDSTALSAPPKVDPPKADQQTSTQTPFSYPPLSSSAPPKTDTPTSTAAAPSPFANFAKPASGASSPSLFGGTGEKQAQSSTTMSQAPNMFAAFGKKADANATTTSTPTLFANLGGENKGAAAAPAPASNLFASVAQKKDAPDPPVTSQATTTTTTTAPSTTVASTSAAAPTSSSLFGGAAKPADSSNTAQPIGGATSGTNALGSSTAGPPPSAQSRLKNKSMDEIITRWASDLNKYQKEFQTQAERVAAWDRMLLENGNAISKLYSKTFQAERDIAEVEKQLTSVEGHQEELSQWLDRYEREVDEMMSRQVGQGEGLQGPDQERERTYKTAERVSERLKDMGKDLTSMIDEINEASASITKTSKADDPLSQIVRILNGHLSQLQLIDQSTSALQAKVTAAQKETKRLGSRGSNTLGSDAVNDFYRSYMGRT